MKEFKVSGKYSENVLPIEHVQYYATQTKKELACQLAEKIFNEIQWKEDYNWFTMEMEISASIMIMDKETIQKFNQAMKLLKEVL